MFLIPIGHESDEVRRLPWITFAIMAICFILHIFISSEVGKAEKQLRSSAEDLVRYYFNHPYLELDPEVMNLMFGQRGSEKMEQMMGFYRQGVSRPGRVDLKSKQQELNQLAQNFKNSLENFPYRKWGFIPAKQKTTALLTYMFIHGGLLHLLGNLLFLYLMGPFIEDVWGRPVYTAFYLIAGVVAALMYALHYPHFAGPLIGASGAIAGVMGAFLIKYWKTKINFFYWIFFFFRGTFEAPAWLMLPLWLLLEIFNAKMIDAVNPDGGGGVAHWAHVWGFVFGMVVALGLKRLKVEEKYIHPKIEAKIKVDDKGLGVVVDAIQKKSAGKAEEAYALLLDEARKNPTCKNVVETLWDVGLGIGRIDEANRFFIKLIESEIRHDQMEDAVAHYLDLKAKTSQAMISHTYKFSLLKSLAEHRHIEEAKMLAEELLEEVDLNSSPVVLQGFVEIALEISPSIAEKVINFCLEHPEIPPGKKEIFKREKERLITKLQTASPS